MLLEVAPDMLLGVEIGRIAGEPFDPDARVSSDEIPHVPCPMGSAMVPEEDDALPNMAEEMAQEG